MDNGMIRKYQKAKLYAEERARFKFQNFTVEIDGKNNPHHVSYDGGIWQCDCDYFIGRGRCSHTMALEILLQDMLLEEQPAD
jgi:hypothetical protein